jgi:hypothetical protein
MGEPSQERCTDARALFPMHRGLGGEGTLLLR